MDCAVRVSKATFVSLLLTRKVIQEHGLPYADFYIWGDDSEYTMRISSKHKSYLVGSSKVVHLRSVSGKLLPYKERDVQRINNLFYLIRNNIYISRTISTSSSTI